MAKEKKITKARTKEVPEYKLKLVSELAGKMKKSKITVWLLFKFLLDQLFKGRLLFPVL